MNKLLLRAWFGVFVFACVLGLALSRHSTLKPAIAATPTPVPSASATPTPPSPALTSPGQTITNAASATYSDGTNTYNILSNTVTVYVQNAPSLVVLTNNGTSTGVVSSNGLSPAASPVPGNNISDVYTLVNTGNGTGYFQLATAAQASPTPLPGTNNGVTQSGPEQSVTYTLSCSYGSGLNASYTSLGNASTAGTLNYDLANNAACNSVPANGSVNISINYQSTGTGTVNTQLEGQVIYSGSGTGYAAASSLWVTNQYNDVFVADERIDVQKSPSPIASDGTVTYTITANNGGSAPANYVNSMGACPLSSTVKVCGPAITGPGLLIADKIPTGASTPIPVISMSPSPGPQATPSGQTVTMVYTTASDGSGWTSYSGGGFPAGTTYVGLYLTGPAAAKIALPADSAAGTSAGNVPAASSQIGWTMKMGPIPANTTAYNIATAPVADNKGCIEGPGLTTTATACDNSGSNTPGPSSNPWIPLSTAPPVPSSPGPGLSNTTTTIAPALYNGPLNQPDAQGCFNSNATPVPFPTWSPMPNAFPTVSPTTYPTCAATDNMDDYTQAVATPTPASTNMPYGGQMTVASTVTVPNEVKNSGTSTTDYSLSFATLPSQVTVSSVTTGPVGTGCTSGPITPTGGLYDLGTIAAGGTLEYCVKYTTATGANAPYYFQPIFVDLRVGYTSAPTVYYNDTWNVLMPGGFIELVKTANILNNGNCAFSITRPNNGVCPGGLIQYAVAYWNALPTSASGSPAEPAAAKLAMSGNLVISENGAANGSNWSTYTGGLFDPAGSGTAPLAAGQTLTSLAANCGLVTLKCGDTNASALFGGTSPNGNLYASTSFTDTIPASGLPAQGGGVLMFATKVH